MRQLGKNLDRNYKISTLYNGWVNIYSFHCSEFIRLVSQIDGDDNYTQCEIIFGGKKIYISELIEQISGRYIEQSDENFFCYLEKVFHKILFRKSEPPEPPNGEHNTRFMYIQKTLTDETYRIIFREQSNKQLSARGQLYLDWKNEHCKAIILQDKKCIV